MKYGKSLLALLGIGVLAYWRYKKLTPKEKNKVMDVLDKAKDKLSHISNEWMSKVEDLKEESSDMAKAMIDEAQEIQEKTSYEMPPQKGNMGKLPGTSQEKPIP